MTDLYHTDTYFTAIYVLLLVCEYIVLGLAAGLGAGAIAEVTRRAVGITERKGVCDISFFIYYYYYYY